MEQIKIDIVPVGVAPVAHASQFDNGRQIRFNLFNQGTPYTLTGAETVTMVVNGEEENITNTSDNYVIWDVAKEDCEEAGVIGCEIRIVLGSMLIGSKNFFLEVEMDPYNGKNIRIVTVGPADICTFETALPEPYQSVLVNVVASGGNGTPDNPIAINGYTEANITRCGVNVWNEETELGIIDTSTGADSPSNYNIRTVGYTKVAPSTEYYAKITSTGNMTLVFYDVSKGFISTKNIYKIYEGGTFTTPSNCAFIRFFMENSYGTTYNNDISINYPSTDTTYHAYNGTTYTIAFGQTVYGGVLDVTRGKLRVTWTSLNLGSINWTYATNEAHPYFYANATGKKAGREIGMLCSIYKYVAGYRSDVIANNYQIGNFNQSDITIVIRNDDYSDAASFKTAMDGVYFYYELATPIEIDLTPVQIRALVGSNNVFADCGETTVEYLDEG